MLIIPPVNICGIRKIHIIEPDIGFGVDDQNTVFKEMNHTIIQFYNRFCPWNTYNLIDLARGNDFWLKNTMFSRIFAKMPRIDVRPIIIYQI